MFLLRGSYTSAVGNLASKTMALLQSAVVPFRGRSRAMWSCSGDSGQDPQRKKHVFLAEV